MTSSGDASPDEPERYVLELSGLAVPGAADHLQRVGAVLAAHPAVTPTRCGSRDPARDPVSDLAAQLAELGGQQAGLPQAMAHLACPERAESGTATYVADPFLGHPPGFVRPSKVELTLAPTDPAALGDVLGELAEAVDAFYGFVASRSHLAQLRGQFGSEQRRRHGPSPSGGQPPTWQPPPFQALEVALPDVFWVQVFGPAFVSHWGEDRLVAAGSRRRRLRNGGYAVWAIDVPPEHDAAVESPEDYGWKASLYDTIGPEPFLRHDQGWNEFGQHVPLMTQHAAEGVGGRLGGQPR